MNVVFAVQCLDGGGGTRVLVAAANALVDAGAHVTFAASRDANACPFPLDPRVVVEVGHPGEAAPSTQLEMAYWYRAVQGADLAVATRQWTAYPVAAALARGRVKRGAYYVQHDEGLAFGWMSDASLKRRWVVLSAGRFSHRLGLEAWYVSRWIRDSVHGPPGVVLPNPVDQAFLDAPPPAGGKTAGPWRVGFMPREGLDKGTEDLVAALEGLRGLDVALVQIGQKPWPGKLPMAAEHVRPKDNAELAMAYGSLDVFLHASRVEGFGLPPLEAMACGACVVLTDSGGVREFARQGENCLMSEPCQPAVLGAEARRVLVDHALRDRLAAAGREAAQGFSPRRFREAVLAAVFKP